MTQDRVDSGNDHCAIYAVAAVSGTTLAGNRLEEDIFVKALHLRIVMLEVFPGLAILDLPDVALVEFVHDAAAELL